MKNMTLFPTARLRTPALIAAGILISLAIFGRQAAAIEHWAGSSDFAGFTALVELQLEMVDGQPRPRSISIFGTAPLHYEFPLTQNQEVQAVPADGSQLGFAFRLRGREYTFEGRRLGDVISGLVGGTALNFYRLESAAAAGGPVFELTGIYEGASLSGGKSSEIIVTPREFGGLRAVNLGSGENMTLLRAGSRKFFTWQELGRSPSPRINIRFPRDMRGEIVAMVHLTGDGKTRVYQKTGGITQKAVKFRGPAGMLAGTLLTPPLAGPRPGLVLVHGSGPIYRSALLDRAVFLAKSGLSVLIYDKRGTGASAGDWRSASFHDLALDALAALERLEAEPGVDGARTGLQGHSQAGYIIPIAATLSEKIDFAIIVNGGSVRPDRQSLFDKANDLKRAGYGAGDQKRAIDLLERVFLYVVDKTGDPDALERDFLAAQKEPWFGALDLPRMPALPRWESDPEPLEAFRRELAFDPIGYQRQMYIPVLVILGGRDQTMPAELAAEGWRSSMALAGNDDFTLRLIPEAGHGMRSLVGGKAVGPLLPAYKSAHRDWLARRLGMVPR
ncbi:MAG: alpha/beta fold hydrolase [Sphingomonadales bacterium]